MTKKWDNCERHSPLKGCPPIFTQCACSWCYFMRTTGRSDPIDSDYSEYVCIAGWSEVFKQNNDKRSCPSSAVCGFLYNKLEEARKDAKRELSDG